MNGTHDHGRVTYVAYRAIKRGQAVLFDGDGLDDGILTVAPATGGGAANVFGVALADAAPGDEVAIAVLGCTPGTLLVLASTAGSINTPVAVDGSDASDSTPGSTYVLGRSLTWEYAAGDLIEVAHCLPVLATALLA